MGPKSCPDGYLRPDQFLDHLTVIKTVYYVEWDIPDQVGLQSYSMVPSQAILGVTERLTKVIDLNPS